MTKAILITAAAVAATLHAQNSFQNSAWLGSMPHSGERAVPEGQMGPVTGKPFSGVETRETKQILSDGSPVTKKSVSKVARDAEGRMRSESGQHAILFDAPTMTNYVMGAKSCTKDVIGEGASIMIAATETGTSVSWHSHTGTPKPDPKITTEELGFQVVNGISAKGTRQTLTIPATALGSDHDIKVVNERWYSEELGVLIRSSNRDPRFGTTTYELSEINQSTPDLSLFTPPTGCNEMQRHGAPRN
jgi:hypothetical protein